MTKTFKAYHQGAKTKAKKVGKHWMVGGDYDTNNALVMLPKACKTTNLITGEVSVSERWAWHQLRGAVLKFQDWAVEEEIVATVDEWVAA